VARAAALVRIHIREIPAEASVRSKCSMSIFDQRTAKVLATICAFVASGETRNRGKRLLG